MPSKVRVHTTHSPFNHKMCYRLIQSLYHVRAEYLQEQVVYFPKKVNAETTYPSTPLVSVG
jgi:hypothetical protein